MKDQSGLNINKLLEGLHDILKHGSLEEVAKSKAQQRLMGMVHAAQKGEKPASKKVADIAKSMGKKDVTDFAKTKHKGLPAKVAEECGCDDTMTDEELDMFSRHAGTKGRHNMNNPWNSLHKKGRHFKSRLRKEDADVEECAGVGIITKQNSTADVNSKTPQKNLDAFNLEEAMVDMCETQLKENEIRKGTQRAVPGLATWDKLDNNNSPYAAYRYGVALAGSPSENMDQHGPVGGKFVTIGYTDEDNHIINQAAKSMGVTSTKHGSKTSQELADVNVKSIVARIKKNKYGV
jgi:hypothetical protein